METFPGIRYEIVVPRWFNKKDDKDIGERIDKEIIGRYLEELLRVFRGMTRFNVAGFWVDPDVSAEGVVVAGEYNYLLRLDGDRPLKLLHMAVLDELLPRMREELEQVEIYCTVSDCELASVRCEEPQSAYSDKQRTSQGQKLTLADPTSWVFLFARDGLLMDRWPGFPTCSDTHTHVQLAEYDIACVIGQAVVEKYHLDKIPVKGRRVTLERKVVVEPNNGTEGDEETNEEAIN